MSEPRESHAVVRLLDGRVFVVGGHHGRRADLRLLASAEMYDPASGIFGPAGSMSTPRHKHDALLLPDGRVLITGGADERDSRGVYRSTEALDPATGVFEPAGDMRLGRYKHRGTSIVLPDGRVLLAGGAAQAELYEPTGGSSSLVPGTTRLSGQFSAAALLADGRVLITGGYGPDIAPQGEAWLYSP